eukprot:COSAG04_NODE_15652_length_525_cov_0.429577_1_plen_44_part_10
MELIAAGSENLAALKAQLSLTAGFNPAKEIARSDQENEQVDTLL